MRKDAAELIADIERLVKGYWSHLDNPELISKDLHEISTLNWALAQWQADYEEQERAMKAELDLSRAKLLEEFTSKGEAVNKAEIKATISLAEMRKDYNKVASLLERIKITDKANSKVMDSARSRIGLIKEQIK